MPAGHRALVKYVSIVPAQTVSVDVSVSLYDGSTKLSFFWSVAWTLGDPFSAGTDIYGVVDEGEDICGFQTNMTGGTAYVHVGGILFEL